MQHAYYNKIIYHLLYTRSLRFAILPQRSGRSVNGGTMITIAQTVNEPRGAHFFYRKLGCLALSLSFWRNF